MISNSIKRCIIFDIDFMRHVQKRYIDDHLDVNSKIPYPLAISSIERDFFSQNFCKITTIFNEIFSSNVFVSKNLYSIPTTEHNSCAFLHNLDLVDCSISYFAEEFIRKEGL